MAAIRDALYLSPEHTQLYAIDQFGVPNLPAVDLNTMDVSIAEARNRLTQIIRAFESGEPVVITRNGRPVAQLASPPPERRKVRFGSMRDQIQLLPGWDDPVHLDRFLEGGI